MTTIFIDNPPAANFLPWNHVPNVIPLDQGTSPNCICATQDESPTVKALQAGWLKKKAEIFAGKYNMPDSEDPDTVRHYNWYEATGFTRPLPRREEGSPRKRLQKASTCKS